MTPYQQNEINLIVRDLKRFSMTHTANRLQKLLEPFDDERPCKVQDRSGKVLAIPWGLAEILYPAYGHDQTLERVHERGGFGRLELGKLAVDAYMATSEDRIRSRLPRWPLLDLYDMARRNQ